MYKKVYLIFFWLCLLVFSAHSIDISSYDDISSLYDRRRIAFKENRNSYDVLDYTHQIKIKLLNSSAYNSDAAAADNHQLIIRTVIASLFIHDGHLGGGTDHDSLQLEELSKTNSFHKILRLIHLISNHLHSSFMVSGYTDIDFKPLQGQFALLSIYTQMSEAIILKEFYTAIEDHYNELSFLRDRYDDSYSAHHKVSHAWLDDVFTQYNAGREEVHRYKTMHSGYTWIKNADGIPIAVYKPISFFHKGAQKCRNIASECFSTLIAQTMGIDVLNYVLPVNVDKAGYMTYSPCQPTGTLEALLGFSDAHFNTVLPDANTNPFSSLISHICTYNKQHARETINCTALNNHDRYHILTKRHFDSMFKHEYRNNDTGYFITDAIDAINLYQIFAFRYLSDYRDMHTDNIIFLPNLTTSKLELKIIDAEYTFDYENYSLNRTIPRRIPKIYELPQAMKILTPAEMQGILMAPLQRLHNIFKTYTLTKTTNPHQMTQKGIKSFFFSRLYWLKNTVSRPLTPGRLLNYIEYAPPIDPAYDKDYFVPKDKTDQTKEKMESQLNLAWHHLPYVLIA